jgi:hypothetical protein
VKCWLLFWSKQMAVELSFCVCNSSLPNIRFSWQATVSSTMHKEDLSLPLTIMLRVWCYSSARVYGSYPKSGGRREHCCHIFISATNVEEWKRGQKYCCNVKMLANITQTESMSGQKLTAANAVSRPSALTLVFANAVSRWTGLSTDIRDR